MCKCSRRRRGGIVASKKNSGMDAGRWAASREAATTEITAAADRQQRANSPYDHHFFLFESMMTQKRDSVYEKISFQFSWQENLSDLSYLEPFGDSCQTRQSSSVLPPPPASPDSADKSVKYDAGHYGGMETAFLVIAFSDCNFSCYGNLLQLGRPFHSAVHLHAGSRGEVQERDADHPQTSHTLHHVPAHLFTTGNPEI